MKIRETFENRKKNGQKALVTYIVSGDYGYETTKDSEYQLNNQWRDENKRCKGSYYFMYFHAVIYLVQIQGHQICFKCYPCAGT